MYSLADSVAILRQNAQAGSKTAKKSKKGSEKPHVKENETAMAALQRMQRSGGGMPNLTVRQALVALSMQNTNHLGFVDDVIGGAAVEL